ncbi:hypothetical protein IWW38_001151 [Coemansia aciculifera]|uniref:Uncharacterized protein n=1 Tax=Coemansia aciculifera TaxID=417176 RepID=A0ACC1M8S3_9FUNG|nr:hypothetical protein IWW38_001151 [Coemansia aciculifera]
MAGWMGLRQQIQAWNPLTQTADSTTDTDGHVYNVQLLSDSEVHTLNMNINTVDSPVLCWMQPEAKSRFAVGTETGLRVYQLANGLNEGSASSPGAAATATTTFEVSEFRAMRHAVTSLAAFPRAARQMSLVAVGNAVGEVGLQFYPCDSGDGEGSSGRDRAGLLTHTAPIYGASERASRALEFNGSHSDLLACGFDHREGRSSLIIHDITRGANVRQLLGSTTNEGVAPRHSRHPSTASSVGGGDSSTSGGVGAGGGAGVTSLCWVPGSADDILVASKRTRSSIRWYDLRTRKGTSRVLYVPISDGAGLGALETIYDLQFDPFRKVRYMAHDRRGTAHMWDIRWTTRPLHTLALGAHSTRVRFSTRRSGMVAAVGGGSNVVSVFSVNEHGEGDQSTGRLSACAFLDDSRAKDRYDEDQSALSAQPPPAGLHIWTERSATAPAGSPVVEFVWIPPAASHASHCDDQLITCSSTGLLLGRSLPAPRAVALSCRGDVAAATNWRGIYANTDAEMASLHAKVPEVYELAGSLGRQQTQGQSSAETNGPPSFSPKLFPPELASSADDVLVHMRQRALRGYGMDAGRNAQLATDAVLRDVWLWVRDADIRRNTGSYSVGYGADVSFLGVYDIMRLRRRQLAHLYTLAPNETARSGQEVAAATRLNGQRQLALAYLGWGLDGKIREQHIHTLENAREYAAAAAASFVYGDHRRSLQSLELSPASDQKLLSFMFKAKLNDAARLTSSFSSEPESAPEDMYASPHLQMIFAYLVTGCWHAVVRHMSGLPLSWRLAVALRYYDDAELMEYLVKIGCDSVRTGALDGLLVTGIAHAGRVLTQNYVDATADVQTASLLTVFDPVTTVDDPAEHWIYSYRHLLNMWRMFTTRSLFDIAHASHRAARGLSRMSEVARDIAVRPADLRCQYCHQSLPNQPPSAAVAAATGAVASAAGAPQVSAMQTRLLITYCHKCGNKLPRCIICRMTLGAPLVIDDQAAADFTQWFSWCQTCGHGGHAAHVHSWFLTHSECPVPGCDCHCERSY